MTERVDFYVLKSAAAGPRMTFACRLAEKAYLRDLKVVVLNGSPQDAALLDELMWTFSERSFVPHELCEDADSHESAGSAVRLTTTLDGAGRADLLLNLSDQLPPGLDRFERVAEILDADVERRRIARERFKVYRDLEVTLDTHHMNEIMDE